MKDLQKRDLKYIWHPCSQMKDYESFPPIIIESGKGVYLYDSNGNSYIDAISSWWVNILGHSNPRLNQALQKQAEKIEHCIFANFSTPAVIELSEKLVELAPGNLSKVFYGDNGSSAVEIALKMSFQYHQQTGYTEKTKFAALTNGYHGETIGALSVSGVDLYNSVYKPLLLDVKYAISPDCYRCEFDKKRDNCNAECSCHLEELFKNHHKEISAFILEPLVQCAGGMKIYPPCYLKKARDLCTKYNILMIADEIAVGFGRTGKMFACEHANITPDFMCISKAVTGGYLPLSAVITSDEIYDAFYGNYADMKAFLHSHSYSGNALACAVACETLNILQDENFLSKNKDSAEFLKYTVLELFKDHPYVGEYRQIGMIGVLELVSDKEKKISFDWKDRVGYHIYQEALKQAVLLRPIGNIIYFMPPYVISNEEIIKMVKVALSSINKYFKL